MTVKNDFSIRSDFVTWRFSENAPLGSRKIVLNRHFVLRGSPSAVKPGLAWAGSARRARLRHRFGGSSRQAGSPPGASDQGFRGAIRRTRVRVDFGSQRKSPLCQTAVDRGVGEGWVRSLRADRSDVSEGPSDGSGPSEAPDQKGSARNPASMSSRRSRLNVKGSIAHHIGR